MTVAETAKRLGVSRSYVYRLIRQGRLGYALNDVGRADVSHAAINRLEDNRVVNGRRAPDELPGQITLDAEINIANLQRQLATQLKEEQARKSAAEIKAQERIDMANIKAAMPRASAARRAEVLAAKPVAWAAMRVDEHGNWK